MTAFRKRFTQIIAITLLSQSLSLSPLAALANSGDIRIAGQPVFSINNAASTGSVSARAQIIQENLDNALVAAQDRSPASVNIVYVKGSPVITLGGYQVVTVDAKDATAAKTTPALLANQWANKIRQSLTDQNSINAYVAQISGSYANNAPQPINSAQNNFAPMSQIHTAPAPYTANTGGLSQAGQPGQTAPSGQNYDQYNTNQAYNPPPQNYAQNPSTYPSNTPNSGPGYRQGRIAYAPAGQIIPVTLNTSIATQVARTGDLIQATISQSISLGDSVIPAGSIVLGQVASAEAGRRLGRSGELQIKFNRIRMPDGTETPISAHIVGGIGKYAAGDQQDQFKGETMKNKVGSVAFRGLLGAGAGAALGTAVGAIAGGGHGAGTGAWSGTAIGGGLGAADSLLLRKGADVTVPSGTNIQLQLDSPVSISGVMPANY